MNTIGNGIISKFDILKDNVSILEFKKKVPEVISGEDSLKNLSRTSNVKIANCFVGSCRARGYLISIQGKELIENNIFETSGSAILISGHANYWCESGEVKDLSIISNEFRSVCNSSPYQFCNAVISIFPEIYKVDSLHPIHKNINIESKTFNFSDYPIFYLKSVDGLSFKNNTISYSSDFESWYSQKYNFIFNTCKNVEISGNKIEAELLSKIILIKGMNEKEMGINNNELQLVVSVNKKE